VPSHLLANATDRAVLLAFAVATAAKALSSVLRTWIEQAFRTRRLIRSLEDARPEQRPGIIIACSQLERGSSTPGSEKADTASHAGEHKRLSALALTDMRGHERHGD
jgi:hypothetical protein